jgi:hypothetical protein
MHHRTGESSMRRRFAGALWGILVIGWLRTPAQTKPAIPLPTIDELRAPASPAFVLMDVSPSSVERPGTPRAFAMSILAATETSDSNWPKDLAVEFAPYWWKSRPKLTFENYYDEHKSVGATILQTLSVSIGTTELEDQTAVPGTRAGLGIKFLFLHGRAAPELKDRVVALREAQLAALECVPDDPSDPVDEACMEKHAASLRSAGRAVAELDKQRRGWLVEFASAITSDFPGDSATTISWSRVGGWLTASYRGDGHLSFVGVARWMRDRAGGSAVDDTDVGGRILWIADPTAMPPLAFSAEYVRRFRSGSEDTDKLVAILEYRTPLDNISLIASYGKVFENTFTGKERLVSTLGINFGFGRGPVVRAAE